MKSAKEITTGVVRRIDELGRIVIPKEMRRVLRIKEGDSIEITNEEENIILKKYSLTESIGGFVRQFTNALNQSSKKDIIITDTDKIISVTNGIRSNIMNKAITNDYYNLIQNKEIIILDKTNDLFITSDFMITKALCIRPITVYGDVIGSIIVIGDNFINDEEKTIAMISSIFFGKYLES